MVRPYNIIITATAVFMTPIIYPTIILVWYIPPPRLYENVQIDYHTWTMLGKFPAAIRTTVVAGRTRRDWTDSNWWPCACTYFGRSLCTCSHCPRFLWQISACRWAWRARQLVASLSSGPTDDHRVNCSYFRSYIWNQKHGKRQRWLKWHY